MRRGLVRDRDKGGEGGKVPPAKARDGGQHRQGFTVIPQEREGRVCGPCHAPEGAEDVGRACSVRNRRTR